MNMNQYVIMRPKSFAIVAMLVIAAALMSSIIPSGDLENAYATEDDYSHDKDSEENGNTEDESDHDESARSEADDDEDSDDDARSQEDEDSDDDDENGEEGDNSEIGTEQATPQKNVCSGWAICGNDAANTDDSAGIANADDSAGIANADDSAGIANADDSAGIASSLSDLPLPL
jgi:hypothetical protein